MAKREYKGFMGLSYIQIKNVPVEESEEFGGIIQARVMKEIEKKVARSILLHRAPIRGKEVEFFRSILGLPQREFSKFFDLSQVAILKWEREKSKRLSLPNEIAFRAVMAKQFDLHLKAEDLIGGSDRPPKQLVVDFEGDADQIEAA